VIPWGQAAKRASLDVAQMGRPRATVALERIWFTFSIDPEAAF